LSNEAVSKVESFERSYKSIVPTKKYIGMKLVEMLLRVMSRSIYRWDDVDKGLVEKTYPNIIS